MINIRNIKCLLGKHELDVKVGYVRGEKYPIFKQTVKCNKCEHTIQIDGPSKEEVYVLIK